MEVSTSGSPIVFIIIFFVFIVVGIYLIIKGIKDKQKCTGLVTGTIVDVEVSKSHDRDRGERVSFFPIFEYVVNGQKYVKKSSSSSNSFSQGQQVEVHYDPNNPENAYMKNNASTFIIMGVLFVIVGIICGIAISVS